MNLQIFGTVKSRATQKANRFFKERGISCHFVDLQEKGISPGELDNICRRIPAADLIDTQNSFYVKGNYTYLDFDPREAILENPLILIQPLVRNGSECTVGLDETTWNKWLKAGMSSRLAY